MKLHASIRRAFSACCCSWLLRARPPGPPSRRQEQRYLYVAAPGIRNYRNSAARHSGLRHRQDHAFVKRIETPHSREAKPDNIKASTCAATRKLYFSTPRKLYCLDLVTEKTLWEIAPKGGCEPDVGLRRTAKLLYVPSFEAAH